MKREIYVFMDSVSRNYGEPFTMANAAELRRHFEQMVRNPAVPAYAIRDTVVIHLGTFIPDSENPIIVPENIPVVVLRGDSYNVDEIRKQDSDGTASAHELCTCEDCETSA